MEMDYAIDVRQSSFHELENAVRLGDNATVIWFWLR